MITKEKNKLKRILIIVCLLAIVIILLILLLRGCCCSQSDHQGKNQPTESIATADTADSTNNVGNNDGAISDNTTAPDNTELIDNTLSPTGPNSTTADSTAESPTKAASQDATEKEKTNTNIETYNPTPTEKPAPKPTAPPSPAPAEKPTEELTDPHAGKTYHEAVYKTVHHDAVYENMWVVDQPAYSYEEPIYEKRGYTICHVCGAEFDTTYENGADSFTAHNKAHMLAGEGGGYHSEVRKVKVGSTTVNVPEEGHYEKQLVKAAYDEKVLVKEAGWY